MARRYCNKEVLPFAVMVAAECCNVGTNILFKAATLKGMSFYVFIAYSFAISNFVLLPFIFIFPSSAVLPSYNFPFISRICLLGFIGFFAQILAYKGIEYSSPTLASATSNLSPAFTFILAIIFRMERVRFRSSSTSAKIIGTIVSIFGALVVLFYKGPTVLSSPSAVSLSLQWPLGSSLSNWLIGGLLLVAERLLFSIWYIVQTEVIKMYPAEFNVVLLYNICGTIISLPICLLAEPNLSSWTLRPSAAFVAVVYSGIIVPFINVAHTWGLHLKGPVYVVIFKPLSIAIATAMSFLFLGDVLYLGSVIGSAILSAGFYAVIWGKAKEEAVLDDDQSPLLPSYKVENM